MADDTLPPVGATVVDGWGETWVLEWQSLGPSEPSEMVWTRPASFGHKFAEMEKGADISRIWQLEQELAAIDAVMARRPALDQPTRREKIEHAISVARRCDDMGQELAALRALAREAKEARDLAPDPRFDVEYQILKRLVALAKETTT